MVLSVFLIVLFLVWLFKVLSPSPRMKKLGDMLPGPKPWPIIGNCEMFLKTDDLLRRIIEHLDEHGPISRVWVGKQLFVAIADPDDVEVILSSTKFLNKSDSYRQLDSWLGNKGLLTSDAYYWKAHRKVLTPSFHFKILETALGIIERHTAVLCDLLEHRVDQEEFDILQYMEKCSLDIICETSMGVQMGIQNSKNSAYLQSVKIVGPIFLQRILKPWLQLEIIFRLSGLAKDFYPALKTMKDMTRKLIQKRRDELKKQTMNLDENANYRKEVKPFLDSMLLNGDFTDAEIEDEVQNFMFAGHDTTMTTMAFCLYAISQHPDVQEKVYEEIQGLLGPGKTELTYQDYGAMRYLENVLKETMRMYTTVPIISRIVPEEVTLRSGYTLPAGSLANLILQHMHNNEKYFPEPDKFVPERFEDKERIINFSFVPFSAGPRNCIGQKFALLEMKVVISTLLRKYRLLPSEKVKSLTLETGLVLRSREKNPLRLTLRHAASCSS